MIRVDQSGKEPLALLLSVLAMKQQSSVLRSVKWFTWENQLICKTDRTKLVTYTYKQGLGIVI